MFINISSDQVIIIWPTYRHLVPYHNLERTLPALLTTYIHTYHPKEILVLNGPGSFTTLRIWCLTINLLKQLDKHPFELYDIWKITLYQYLYQAGVLSSPIAIYLGQRKNCRKVNLENGQRENISYTDIANDTTLMIDQIVDLSRFFGEEQVATTRVINFERTSDGLSVRTSQGSCRINQKILWLNAVQIIQPRYELDPTLG